MINFFKYFSVKKIKVRISGFYNFSKNNKFTFAAKLRRLLLNKELNFKNLKFSKLLFQDDFNSAKLALNQSVKNFFFIINVGFLSKSFDEAVVGEFANKKYKTSFNVIMPYEYRHFLQSHNINFPKKYWFIIWNTYLIKKIFLGLFSGFYFIVNNFKCLFKKNLREKYIHIESTDILKNLDQFDNQKISFFLKKIVEIEKISKISNTNIYIGPISGNIIFYFKRRQNFRNKNFFIKYEIPPCLCLYNIKDNIKFIIWFFSSLITVIVSFFIGRWWNIILFEDSIKKFLIKSSSIENTPKIHVRNYNGNLEYPMSIQELQKKKCKTIFCFYSINGEGYLTNENYPLDHSSWGHLKWGNYYCWNDHHKEYLIECLKMNNNYDEKRINFSVVGPITFNISKRLEYIKYNQNKNLSIFDIRIRKIFYRSTSSYYSILDADYVSRFLLDVYDICSELNINMVHKQKRSPNKKTPEHKKYISTINYLNKSKNYFNVDNDVCIEDLLDNSIGSISVPFTSAPLMSNKPAVYYDPLNKIISNEKNGIKIIKNKNDLKKWLKFLLNK